MIRYGVVTNNMYGRVMLVNALTGPAPSIFALSYSSAGIFIRITDEINLEQEQSKINLAQSIQRVELTGNSLEKAEENEAKAIERYNDGKASVDEVIDAQVYKLTTQSYFVEAKLAMQINYSEMLKSLNAY